MSSPLDVRLLLRSDQALDLKRIADSLESICLVLNASPKRATAGRVTGPRRRPYGRLAAAVRGILEAMKKGHVFTVQDVFNSLPSGLTPTTATLSGSLSRMVPDKLTVVSRGRGSIPARYEKTGGL